MVQALIRSLQLALGLSGLSLLVVLLATPWWKPTSDQLLIVCGMNIVTSLAYSSGSYAKQYKLPEEEVGGVQLLAFMLLLALLAVGFKLAGFR